MTDLELKALEALATDVVETTRTNTADAEKISPPVPVSKPSPSGQGPGIPRASAEHQTGSLAREGPSEGLPGVHHSVIFVCERIDDRNHPPRRAFSTRLDDHRAELANPVRVHDGNCA